jgi:hypothetical protein
MTMRRTRIFTLPVALGLALLLAALPTLFSPVLQGQVSTVGTYVVPYTACGSTVSANSTGTNGFTTAGTSNTPVDQASTSITGTNTHTYVCDITPPSRLGGGAVTAITNVVFFYGTLNTLGNQVSTLASGTFNSSIVFGKILMPAATIPQTASTVAPVRADSGTLLITPVAAAIPLTTVTAGQFNTIQFTPATAIVIADLTKYLLTVTLQGPATSTLATYTTGAIVHTR